MAEKPEIKPTFVETISSFSPWGSRAATPRSNAGQDSDKEQDGPDKLGAKRQSIGASGGASGSVVQRGGDHSVSNLRRINPRAYPDDCPKLNVQWFHAADVALRKPNYGPGDAVGSNDGKPPPAPKKWATFSANDSRAIETAFQKVSEEEETASKATLDDTSDEMPSTRSTKLDEAGVVAVGKLLPERNIRAANKDEDAPKVPVNEDYLFDVDIKNRELAPAYWLGPVYSVRRGTWFFVEGTKLNPCDETLALQLEEGYIKTKPWRLTSAEQRSSSHPREKTETTLTPQKGDSDKNTPDTLKPVPTTSPPPSYRLFGSHMNYTVTYEDGTTAWILSDDFLSRMSSTMYQRFAGGAHLSGTKVLRGFQDISKKKVGKESPRPTTPTKSTSIDSSKHQRSASAPPEPTIATSQKTEEDTSAIPNQEAAVAAAAAAEGSESQVQYLQRQMSNLVVYQQNPEKQDEEVRKREEREIQEEYKDTPGDAQDREIEHLILVTHGIGQRLGARFETFNFIHDVNELRKTLKSVYSMSADLQALNAEIDKMPKNCRVQVLPICWRHLLDFPQQSRKHNRKEFDLGDDAGEAEDPYPSLEDITIDGVPALRNIIADLALDVLLYQTHAYHAHISRVVAMECNRILKLFKKRNPNFSGKVSLIGHSLGSAVLFDLLSNQVADKAAFESSQKTRHPQDKETKLDFNVENLICFGSPIGLFQMLNGRTISGRSNPNQVTLDGSEEGIEDPFESAFAKASRKPQMETNNDAFTSSPKCKQLFNIFHPSDPISYRLEPLISPSMSSLQPQNLPYTKNSFLGAPMGQGITGIPARVGQSFTGLWSTFSSGIANNFINRSLGISAEDAIKMGAPSSVAHSRGPSLSQSGGAGTNITGGGVISPEITTALPTPEDSRKRKLAQDTTDARRDGQHPPTLIDRDMETLYSGFQKRRKSQLDSDASRRDFGDNSAGLEAEGRERQLKREEAKVRALNSNGRVDYSIQEGAFDISFIQSIASHLTYWTDEDVCHFLISQLLSRQRVVRSSRD